MVTGTGDYRPYEDIVRAATAEMDLPPARAEALLDRWGELEPWPGAPGVLQALAGRRLAIVTNCSQSLAERAAAATGASFEAVVSAERAGAYKTDARAYRAGLSALGLPTGKVLFVAGSAHDVTGAGALGLPVYWSNRQRQEGIKGDILLYSAINLYISMTYAHTTFTLASAQRPHADREVRDVTLVQRVYRTTRSL